MNTIKRESAARLSAQQLNAVASTKAVASSITAAADGEIVPVVIGRRVVQGSLIARGVLGTDLVVAYGWCVGGSYGIEQIESVTLDDLALAGDVSVTHYLGTSTQTADPWLSSAIAGYTSTLRPNVAGGTMPVAYSVFRLPVATGRTWPRSATAVIKGLKCMDPRTGVAAYSENPAVALYELATNPIWGAPLALTNVTEGLNWSDSLVDGEARCRVGLEIRNESDRDDTLKLLAEYAELIWPVDDGEALRLVPDAAVDAPARVLTMDDLIEVPDPSVGALTRTPTEVTVRYTDTTAGTARWPEVSSTPQRLNGVATGLIARRTSSVSYPGVFRASEASRKAAFRLRRLQYADKYTFVVRDPYMRLRRGAVLQIDLPEIGMEMWVRVMKISARERLGTYALECERYLSSFYSDEITTDPGATTPVPVGAIVPMVSGTLPSGWAAWTAANGKAVRGATTAGTTGGDNTISLSGTITAAGGHNGTGFSVIKGGTDNASLDNHWGADLDYAQPDHTHTVSGTATANPSRAAYPWIIKTGTPGTLVPINAGVLSHGELGHINIQRVLDSVGRMLAAATAKALSGSDSLTLSPTYSAVANHAHGGGVLDNETSETGSTHAVYEHLNAGGHSHAGSGALSVTLRHKRRRMVLHTGVADYPLLPGAYIGWDGSAGANPGAGWVLADGSNGTVNLMGHLVELADPSVGGSVNGDDTYAATGSTNTDGAHSHRGAGTTSNKAIVSITHSTTAGAHAHTVSKTGAYTPPWYGLQFWMWTGAV